MNFKSGNWIWLDNSEIDPNSFINWRLNHPNSSVDGSCAVIDSTGLYKGEWISVSCTEKYNKYICSKPASNLTYIIHINIIFFYKLLNFFSNFHKSKHGCSN